MIQPSFNRGDWVFDGRQLACVRDVYLEQGDTLLDLVMYSVPAGKRLGRVSPPCGGPRTFEPACSAKYWRRIERPQFPLTLRHGRSGCISYSIKYI